MFTDDTTINTDTGGRDQARADLFDYIEVFYNRKRRHGYLGNISPDDFEERTTGSF